MVVVVEEDEDEEEEEVLVYVRGRVFCVVAVVVGTYPI